MKGMRHSRHLRRHLQPVLAALALATGLAAFGLATLGATTVDATGIEASGAAPGQPAPEPAAAQPQPPDAAPARSWSDRLQRFLHNPKEQTDDAVAAYREQRFEESLPPAHKARELAPDEPLTGYNSGTVELAAGRTDEAISTFEETLAALQTPRMPEDPEPAPGRSPESRFRHPALAASTFYNLGNARLSQGDPAGAVEAYEEALRLAPSHDDAKFNLELALRELERQNPPPQPQQQPQEGGGEGESPPEPQPGPEEGEEQEQPGDQGSDPDESRNEPRPEDSRLQEFEDQPDMTAEEAAAILEAVESLERQQRRDEAAERARSAASRGEKDW